MTADYPWLPSYEAAILETDRSKLPKHVKAAERAITSRIQELNRDHGGTEEERMAIRDALSGLNILRNELSESIQEGNSRTRFRDRPLPNDSGLNEQDHE